MTNWNDEEDMALQGLPWLAQIVYLRGIRRFMDYQTGVVGVRRGISYQSIAETAYVEPLPGRHSADTGAPSARTIRTAIDNLIKAGLLVRQGDDSRLVFLLPLASRDESAQKSSVRGTSGERQGRNVSLNSISDSGLGDRSVRGEGEEFLSRIVTPPLSVKSQSQSQSQRKNRYVHSLGESADLTDNLDTSDPVVQVFMHWQAAMNKTGVKLDSKRRSAIAGRLKDGYSVEKLMTAVTGCAQSEWHQGKNKNAVVYDDIELICRDAPHVDAFVQITSKQMSPDKGEWDDFLYESSVIKGECSHG